MPNIPIKSLNIPVRDYVGAGYKGEYLKGAMGGGGTPQREYLKGAMGGGGTPQREYLKGAMGGGGTPQRVGEENEG